ncbi:outer membrane beta-barrel protein [Polaribacter sp. R77954]|uniref:outer membrane beta-barrel protein n=1 Tax=Polaribacter sp. R77954 TaxID=3093870 RepID=UPI0037CBBA83
MKLQKITIILITLFTITMSAQTEKGGYYIGANSNFNFLSSKTDYTSTGSNTTYSSTNSNKYSQFNANAEFGYFLIDKLTSGLNVSYTQTKPKDSDSRAVYTISPFVKYYFLENNLKPFARASYGFGKIKDAQVFYGDVFNTTVTTADTNINVFNLGAGLAYFANNFISIELIFNYSETNFKTTTPAQTIEQTDKIFRTNLGFSIFL